MSPLACEVGAWRKASWLRCHPDKSALLLITRGKQSEVMVGIISAALEGRVPAIYYSHSQFWLAFHFLLDSWNPAVIEKDTFPHIYLCLPFLQSRPHSCDSCLYHLQTHHCLTHPHHGSISDAFGSWLERQGPACSWPVLLWAHGAGTGFGL